MNLEYNISKPNENFCISVYHTKGILRQKSNSLLCHNNQHKIKCFLSYKINKNEWLNFLQLFLKKSSLNDNYFHIVKNHMYTNIPYTIEKIEVFTFQYILS